MERPPHETVLRRSNIATEAIAALFVKIRFPFRSRGLEIEEKSKLVGPEADDVNLGKLELRGFRAMTRLLLGIGKFQQRDLYRKVCLSGHQRH
jgi:hypothetical protein